MFLAYRALVVLKPIKVLQHFNHSKHLDLVNLQHECMDVRGWNHREAAEHEVAALDNWGQRVLKKVANS